MKINEISKKLTIDGVIGRYFQFIDHEPADYVSSAIESVCAMYADYFSCKEKNI